MKVAVPILMALVTLVCCRPMHPSGGREKAVGGISIVLSHDDMMLLTDENPMKVRIRTFQVVDEATAAQEGSDHVYDLAQDQDTYKVSDVALGMKEFQVDVLNQATEVVGQGKARHLVKPGPQSLGMPLEIKLRPPNQRRRDFEMNLYVTINDPGHPTKTTYLDLRDLVTNTCTNGCHTTKDGAQPKLGLNLADFPFSSVLHPEWTEDDIVTEMLIWMRDATDPMPPNGPRLPADQIALFDKWKADGLPKFPSADQTADLAKSIRVGWKLHGSDEAGSYAIQRASDVEHPFHDFCKNLVINGSYDIDLTVLGVDGTPTYEVSVKDLIVGDYGIFEKVLEIPYQRPSVDIPVVVTR